MHSVQKKSSLSLCSLGLADVPCLSAQVFPLTKQALKWRTQSGQNAHELFFPSLVVKIVRVHLLAAQHPCFILEFTWLRTATRPFKSKMIDVAVGAGHLATLTDEGRLFLTGSNVFGELGVGAPWYKRSSRTEPSPITALKDYNVLQVPSVRAARDIRVGCSLDTGAIEC